MESGKLGKAYFVSDAHFGVSPAGCAPEREEHFISFVNGLCGKATHLFIVGDLFEFWYEYDFYMPSRHAKLLMALAGLKASGCEVKLIKGNHDFGYGSFFSRELGIETLQSAVAELHGRRVYICHGDGIAKSDGSYRFFRKLVDFKLCRFLFKWLHPDIGMRLALFIGSNSRSISKKRIIPEEDYFEKARELMRKNNCDTFAHGHNHRQGLWKVPEGVIINCGNWLFSENYSCISEKICYIYNSPLAEPSSAS